MIVSALEFATIPTHIRYGFQSWCGEQVSGQGGDSAASQASHGLLAAAAQEQPLAEQVAFGAFRGLPDQQEQSARRPGQR